MKKTLAATTALLVLLLAITPAIATVVQQEEHHLKKMNNSFERILKSSMYDKPAKDFIAGRAMEKSISSHNGYMPVTYLPRLLKYERKGIVYGDIAEYEMEIEVGSGKYDRIKLTGFAKETPGIVWHSDSRKLLILSAGESLNERSFSDMLANESMALYFAEQGYNTVVIGRREANVPAEKTNFDFMQYWTSDTYVKDMYIGIVAAKLHTMVLNGNSDLHHAKRIKTYALGYSLGAWLITEYEASAFDDDYLFGNIDGIIPTDIIIRFDPSQSDLIDRQAARYYYVKQQMDSQVFNNSEMAGMIFVSHEALVNKDGPSSIIPGLTNREAWRYLVTQTFAVDPFAFTPDFHYLTGDLSGLYYAEEERVLRASVSAVPHSPLALDLSIAGLEGNIEGRNIDETKVDSPVLYVGFGGGFGAYGQWWYREEVGRKNPNVDILIWGNGGHGSGLFDREAPTQLWPKIAEWMANN